MEIVFQNIQFENKLFFWKPEEVRVGRVAITVALTPLVYRADQPKGRGTKEGTGGFGTVD
jgi:hypothetical protein